MLKVIAIEEPGSASAADSVRLDHDRRSRRRMVMTTDAGRSVLLDQLRAPYLRDGALLRLTDGGLVRVDAEAEPLLEITAPSLAALVRIAWHLGNRHLPTQLLGGARDACLRIRDDHVIASMVAGLGGTCRAINAPFDPERGAYAGAPSHGHSHGHDHGHAHHAGHGHG